jgi:hypothetical protein
MLQPDKLKKLNENALKMAQAGKSKEDILAMKDAFITQFGTEDVEKKNPVATSTSNGPKLESVQTVGSSGGVNTAFKSTIPSPIPDFNKMKTDVGPTSREAILRKKLSNVKVTPENMDEISNTTDELSKIVKAKSPNLVSIKKQEELKKDPNFLSSYNDFKTKTSTVTNDDVVRANEEFKSEIDDNEWTDYLREGAKKAVNNVVKFANTPMDAINRLGGALPTIPLMDKKNPLENKLKQADDYFLKLKKESKANNQPIPKFTEEQRLAKAKELYLKDKIDSYVYSRQKDYLQEQDDVDGGVLQSKFADFKRGELASLDENEKTILNKQSVQEATHRRLQTELENLQEKAKTEGTTPELQKEFDEKLAQYKQVESDGLETVNQYVSNRDNIGNVADNLDVFKRNYGLIDNITGNVRSASENLASGAFGALDYAMEAKKQLTGGQSANELAAQESFKNISKEFQTESERTASKIERPISVENINGLSDFGDWLMNDVTAKQIPIFAMVATGAGGIAGIGGTSLGTKYEEMKGEVQRGEKKYSTAEMLTHPLGYGLAETASAAVDFMVMKNAGRVLASATAPERRMIAKGMWGKAKDLLGESVKGSVSETLDETATQGIENVIDGKPFTEGMVDAGAAGGAMGFLIPFAAANYKQVLKPFTTDTKIQEESAKVLKFQSQLDNPNLDIETKAIINESLNKSKANVNALVKKTIGNVKSLSNEQFKEIVLLEKLQSNIRNQAEKIQFDDNLDNSMKKQLLNDLKAEFNANNQRRLDLLDNGAAVQLEQLDDKEVLRLKNKASRELTKELNPDGTKNITLSDKEISKKAIEIYKEETKLKQIKDVETQTPTPETKPQAEVPQQAEAEKVEDVVVPSVENNNTLSHIHTGRLEDMLDNVRNRDNSLPSDKEYNDEYEAKIISELNRRKIRDKTINNEGKEGGDIVADGNVRPRVEPVGEVRTTKPKNTSKESIPSSVDGGEGKGDASVGEMPKQGTPVVWNKEKNYRGVDTVETAIGEDVSWKKGGIFSEDAFILEFSDVEGQNATHQGTKRGDLTNAKIEKVYYAPDFWAEDDMAKEELAKMKAKFPDAEFIEIELFNPDADVIVYGKNKQEAKPKKVAVDKKLIPLLNIEDIAAFINQTYLNDGKQENGQTTKRSDGKQGTTSEGVIKNSQEFQGETNLKEKILKISQKGKTPLAKRKFKGDRAKANAVEPHDENSLVLQHFVSGGKISSDAVLEILKSDTEVKARNNSFNGIVNKSGKGIDALAHDLWESNSKLSISKIKDAIIDVVTSHNTVQDITNTILKNNDVHNEQSPEYHLVAQEAYYEAQEILKASDEEMQTYEDALGQFTEAEIVELAETQDLAYDDFVKDLESRAVTFDFGTFTDEKGTIQADGSIVNDKGEIFSKKSVSNVKQVNPKVEESKSTEEINLKQQAKDLANAEVDRIAQKLKDLLPGIKDPDLHTQGISQDQLIDLVATAVKKLIGAGIEIDAAIKQVVDSIKAKFGEIDIDIDEIKERINPKKEADKADKESVNERINHKEETSKELESFRDSWNREPSSDEYNKYDSGRTIEREHGELRNEQNYEIKKDLARVEIGLQAIEHAKKLFGAEYIEKTLEFLQEANLSPEKKAVGFVLLENEMDARVKAQPKSIGAKKLQDLVREKSQEFLANSARAIGAGRMRIERYRELAKNGFASEEFTNSLYSSQQLKDKAEIDKLVNISSEDLNKNDDSNITEEIKFEEPKVKRTKEAVKSDLKEALANMRKALNKSALDSMQVGIPYAKQIAVATPHIFKIAKLLAELGEMKTAEIVDFIHEELKEKFPSIGKKEITEILKSETAKTPKSKEEIQNNSIRETVKQALIDAGFYRNVKYKGEIVKRLDWKKIAGEENSVEKLRANVEKSLKEKGLSQKEISKMSKALESEYNRLSEEIIEKGLKELESRNTPRKPVDMKSAAKKLAEYSNYGLFDKNRDSYEYLVNSVLGFNGLDQEAFIEMKQLAKAYVTLMNSGHTEVAMKSALNEINRKQAKLLGKLSFKQSNVTFKVIKVLAEITNLSTRFKLVNLGNLAENISSGVVARVINNLTDTFVNKVKGTETTNKKLSSQSQRNAQSKLKGIITDASESYGDTSSLLLNHSMLEDYLNEKSRNKLYHTIISTYMGRPVLEGADSYNKILITEAKMNRAVIKILEAKGMSNKEALSHVTESLTGESFETALVKAKDLIEKINTENGSKLLVDTKEAINALASDIVKDALLKGDTMTPKELEASYKAAYKSAGRDIGHVSNNWLSTQIGYMNSSIEKQITEAIKEKDWSKASIYTAYQIFWRNFMSTFVGGGTNWVVKQSQKSANPLSLISLVDDSLHRKGNLDITTDEGIKKMEEQLHREMNYRSTAGTIVFGTLAALTIFGAMKASGGDDDLNEWLKKNKWAKKFFDKMSPDVVVAMLAYKNKDMGRYFAKMLNVKADFFDDQKNILKVLNKYAEGKNDEASGQLGGIVGKRFEFPGPLRLINDMQQIYKKETPDYGGVPSGFWNGFFANGILEKNDLRPDPNSEITKGDSKGRSSRSGRRNR